MTTQKSPHRAHALVKFQSAQGIQMAKALTEIRSLARTHTEKAIAVLASIMNSAKAPPAARAMAANSLLDRGWGKPTLQIADESGEPLIPTITFRTIYQSSADTKVEGTQNGQG